MNIADVIPLADTWMHGGWGWGWMAMMMVVMVLFWAAVIFGIVWVIRNTFDRRPAPRAESAIDVLERRFAEGAVSVEEYKARREVLLDGLAGSNGVRREEPLTEGRTAERGQR
jgi:putative membrane protein